MVVEILGDQDHSCIIKSKTSEGLIVYHFIAYEVSTDHMNVECHMNFVDNLSCSFRNDWEKT